MKSNRTLVKIALTLLLISSTAPLPGQSPARPKAKQENRFLIVLNTSSAMSRRSENMQGVIGNLVASGLKGEIKPGDTLGVWTYNDTLRTGQFPLRTWSAQTRQSTAMALVEFIKQQKFEKRARFDNVMENLSALTKISDRLTVLILTDGAELISGTPFDNELNASFKLNESDQRKARMPFVVVLRSENGKFTGHRVNVPPWAVEFPKFTQEPDPVVISQPKIEPEKQVVVPSLIISNPPPRVEIVPSIPAPTNPPSTAITAPAEINTNTTKLEPEDKAVSTNPVPRDTNMSVGGKIASQPSQFREPGNSPAPDLAAPTRAEGGVSSFVVWIAVVCMLLGAAGLIYGLMQRSRMKNHESLITRSMDDKHK